MDIGFDSTSYVMGLEDGRKAVVIESDSYSFTDPESDGNIIIAEV